MPGRDGSLLSLGEVRREREIDPEIHACVAENTPQSMLRDLHRPVTEWTVGIFNFTRYEIPKDAGREAVREVKAMYVKDLRIPIVQLARANEIWQSGWAELRHLLTSEWKESPRLGQGRQGNWLGKW